MSGRKNLWWNRLWHLVSRGHCNVWVCPSQLLLVWWFSNVSILTMMIMLQHKCNPEIPIGFYYPSICNQSSSAKSRLGQENQNQNTESCIKICLWAVRRPKAENDDPRPFSWLKIEKEVSKEILWSNNFFIKLWSSYFFLIFDYLSYLPPDNPAPFLSTTSARAFKYNSKYMYMCIARTYRCKCLR